MRGIDASVACKWLCREDYSVEALALAADAIDTGNLLIAPPLVRPEVINVIRKRARVDRLLPGEAMARLEAFLAYPVVIHDPPDLDRRALTLALQHMLGGQDAHYVALTEIMGCELWTADERLLRAAKNIAHVKFIGDYGE
jgi:predicted nucleic acid-binding protein